MKFLSDILSLAKVTILSRGSSTFPKIGKGRELAILGNGPSLRQTLDTMTDRLRLIDLMTVNFAPNTPEFFDLRPRWHVMADGHFFNGITTDNNVKQLWDNIKSVRWDMTLLLPSKYKHYAKALLIDAPHIKVLYFNLTPVEGSEVISHLLYDLGRGMPRPRNVMIPALMCGISLAYKKIYLFGADHTWTKTLEVAEDNTVISVQPHFYKDNDREEKRVRETYKNIKLHEVLESMMIAFRSYHQVEKYAQKKGVTIINATPGSMIDAFKKSTLRT